MDVSFILKIAGIGMLVTVACQILKRSEREDMAMLVTISGVVIILIMLINEMGRLFDTVKSVFGF